MINLKKTAGMLLITIFFFCLTLIYLFPLTQGLILLPLDLLISNYSPWYSPGTILLKNSYMQDSIVQLYPWKHLVFQSLQNGIIPFWNPYQNMGMPFMASMKPAVFYPLNILYALGEVNAWNALLFLQIFLSMVFTYLLSRDFKLGILPSILASFAFALNSLMIGVLEFGSEGHVLLWLPLFILCAKRYLERQEGRYLFLLGISVGISIFAGQLQYTAYALALLAGFILLYGYTLKTRIFTYGFLFLSIFLGIGVSAIQLIPSIELFFQSYRGAVKSYEIFARGLIRPHELFRLLSPDFFGSPSTKDLAIGYIETSGYFGIIPLFFSFYAIIFARKNIFVKFFTGAFIITILLSLQGIGQILYILKIPVLTSASGDRIFYLVHFSGAILSGFGLSEFINTENLKRNLKAVCTFTLMFVIVVIMSLLTADEVKVSFSNLRFASVILGAFLLGTFIHTISLRRKEIVLTLFMLFVVGLTYLDLFRLGYRFLTFSNEKFLYPEMDVTKFVREAQRETLARNFGLTEPELATQLNVYTIETYNPLYLFRNAQLLHALLEKPNEKFQINPYFVTGREEKVKHALDFLGVSLFVINKDSNPSIAFFNTSQFQNSFELIYKDDRYAVYKNATANPRFQLYYDTQIVENDEEALRLISQRPFDFTKKLIIEEKLPIALEEGYGSIKLLSSTLNTALFEIKTNKPGLFYISDTYFPGWKVKVNNKEGKIYRANYNFRAVLVPAGESIVEFSYLPTNFQLGIWMSLLSLSVLAILSVLHKRVYNLLLSK